ncbi:hypothetical protein F4818DRAFT_403050 [Hypoxylon cercidicola]|nr:hypothetical protein F4818DRAFT_403050 [Hypoxylon cercidicola]
MCRNLGPAIRMLKVSGGDRDELVDGKETLIRLVDMLPGMRGLRDLDWNVGEKTPVPIPVSILELLPFNLRLHTTIICEEDIESHAQARESLAHLASNRNLFSLSVKIWYTSEQECLETMQALRGVLLSCPNLVGLPLIDVSYPSRPPHGLMEAPISPQYCGLGLSSGEKPPALEELGIQMYPWGGDRYHRNINIGEGYPEKGLELEYWAKTFDSSRLLRLNDIPSFIALLIPTQLVSLREVVVGNRFYAWDKTEFLNKIPSKLEFLSIPSLEHVGYKPDSIIRHGSWLRKLQVHQLEHVPYCFMPDQYLAQLSSGLPHLEELAIHIARDEGTNNWPYAALDAIARFPRLRTVELWFRLGHGRESVPTPFVTASSARHLFSYLRERSKSIQCLIIHSGAPLDMTKSIAVRFWPAIELSWAVCNSVTLVCNVVYKGHADGGFLSVTCPGLSNELNKQLERL